MRVHISTTHDSSDGKPHKCRLPEWIHVCGLLIKWIIRQRRKQMNGTPQQQHGRRSQANANFLKYSARPQPTASVTCAQLGLEAKDPYEASEGRSAASHCIMHLCPSPPASARTQPLYHLTSSQVQ